MENESSISLESMDRLRAVNPFLSNTELAYRLVLDDIVEHRILPGNKLNQEQIADTLKMSRSPVREALIQLEREGYLVKGAQGYTVYEMKIGDYMMLLDLRMAIECLAARLACSRARGSELKAMEDNIKYTHSLLKEGNGRAWDGDFNVMDKALADKLFFSLGKADQDFHLNMIQASHNRYVVETYRSLMPRIHFFRYTALDVGTCLNMYDRHKKIYQAVLSRDEEQAEARMRTHLSLTVTRAMRY